MQAYLDLIAAASSTRAWRSRTAPAPARCSVFGHQMRFDLAEGFPAAHHQEAAPALDHHRAALVPARRHQRALAAGEQGQHLGRMGRRGWRTRPVYGKQWRAGQAPDGREIDQIAGADRAIKRNPGSRRQIVTAWNPAEIDQMALPPCHCLFQTYVADGRLYLPALSAQRRRLPRRAIQHRQLRPADPHARPAMRARARRLRLDRRRLPPLLQPSRPGPRAVDAATPRAVAEADIQRRPAAIDDYRYEDFEISGYDPHPAHQGRRWQCESPIALSSPAPTMG